MAPPSRPPGRPDSRGRRAARRTAAPGQRRRPGPAARLLREHYALGNLDDAELDRRTGLVLAARYTDGAAVLAGLPLLRRREAGQAGQARGPGHGGPGRAARASRPPGTRLGPDRRAVP